MRKYFHYFSRKAYFPFVLLAVLLTPFYIFATGKFGDDIYFQINNPLKDGLLNCMMTYYKTGSPRVIIMPVVITLNLLPFTVWRLLDLSVLLLTSVCLSKLFVRNRDANYFLVGCVLLYPYWHVGTTGWISSTCGYSWPLAFGLFALLTLKRLYDNRKISPHRLALCGLAFLYATDAEQLCVVFVALFAILLINSVYSGFIHPRAYTAAVILLLIMSVLRLTFTLTAPGNELRLLNSMDMFAGFGSFSLWRKLWLGFDLTVTHYAACTLGLFLCFSFLLLLSVWKRNKNIFKRCIACIPFASCLTGTMLAGMRALMVFRGLLADGRKRGFVNAVFASGLVPDISVVPLFQFLFVISIFCSLYLAFDSLADRLKALVVMSLGFGSQLMMGFSPTMYASALRTFIYASFSLVICSIWLYEGLRRVKAEKILFITACAGNYLLTFAFGLFKVGAP